MPRYFFRLSKGNLVLVDHVGVMLPDIHIARHEALKELVLLATEEFHSTDVSRVQVHDFRGNVLLTVTAGEASETTASSPESSPGKIEEWTREGELAADLARWAQEQRAIIRELGDAGRDVTVAEELLHSITHLYAGRVAARILKRVARKAKGHRPRKSSGNP